MVEDNEYGCSVVGVVAGACSLEDGCLAVPVLVTGVCCLLGDGPFGSSTFTKWSYFENCIPKITYLCSKLCNDENTHKQIHVSELNV